MAPTPDELVGKFCLFWLHDGREIFGKYIEKTPYTYVVTVEVQKENSTDTVVTDWWIDRADVVGIATSHPPA